MDNKVNNSFVMIDENGVERKYDVLFTFESEETQKSYIAYTDNSKDEQGKLAVYASTYDPTGQDASLKAIETEKEWKIIETILQTSQEQITKNSTDNEQ